MVFFPLCSDFSTVSTYLVEGEQNTAPQWAMLARGLSWAEGHRDAAEPGGPPASLSAFRNCDCGPRQTEPPAAMAVLWLAGQQLPLSTSEASGPVPSLSSGYCRGLSSLTTNGPCFYGGPVSTKLVYHLLTSYVSQLQTSQRIQKGSFCYPCSLVQLGGSPGCGWEILGPLRRTSQGSESLRQSPGSLPAGSVEVRVGKVLF